MPRRPWSEEELRELAAIKPRDRRGAVAAHARRWGRGRGSVYDKLQSLRIQSKAADVPHGARPQFPVHRFD
jgi:hypothetical protein